MSQADAASLLPVCSLCVKAFTCSAARVRRARLRVPETEGSENRLWGPSLLAPPATQGLVRCLPQWPTKQADIGSSHCGSAVMHLTSIHEDAGSIPGLTQWIKDQALL